MSETISVIEKYQDERLSDVRVSTDTVGDYIRHAGNHELLTAEQEIALAQQMEAGLLAREMLEDAQDGDSAAFRTMAARHAMSEDELRLDLEQVSREGERARATFFLKNQRLVIKLASRHKNRGLEFADLIAEGNIGLDRAIDKFDYQKGFKFSTYASWWVRQAISRAIDNQSRAVRLPAHMSGKVNSMFVQMQELPTLLGHEPCDEELADALDITIEELRELRRVSQIIYSLNSPVGSDEDSSAELGDLIADEEVDFDADIYDDQLRTALNRSVERLNDKQRTVIEYYFGLNGKPARSTEYISELLDMTQSGVNQLRNRALQILRDEYDELVSFKSNLD